MAEALSIGANNLSADSIVSKERECDFHLHQSIFTPTPINQVCGFSNELAKHMSKKSKTGLKFEMQT
jgi:hypothetical protein